MTPGRNKDSISLLYLLNTTKGVAGQSVRTPGLHIPNGSHVYAGQLLDAFRDGLLYQRQPVYRHIRLDLTREQKEWKDMSSNLMHEKERSSRRSVRLVSEPARP